jgi:hypothetical protein
VQYSSESALLSISMPVLFRERLFGCKNGGLSGSFACVLSREGCGGDILDRLRRFLFLLCLNLLRVSGSADAGEAHESKSIFRWNRFLPRAIGAFDFCHDGIVAPFTCDNARHGLFVFQIEQQKFQGIDASPG